MKIPEFYPEKQGRPYVPPGASLDGRGGAPATSAELVGTARSVLYFNSFDIDGGDIGDVADALVAASIRDTDDGLTRAMDYLYNNLDGGLM